MIKVSKLKLTCKAVDIIPRKSNSQNNTKPNGSNATQSIAAYIKMYQNSTLFGHPFGIANIAIVLSQGPNIVPRTFRHVGAEKEGTFRLPFPSPPLNDKRP